MGARELLVPNLSSRGERSPRCEASRPVRMRDLREAVWERQAGLCAVTGLPLDWDRDAMHHRRPGSMGGTGRPNQQGLGNVIGLLARVHNFGAPGLLLDGEVRSVHGSPVWSKPLGLLLSASVDEPSSVPVRLAGIGWAFLSDDGRITPVT